MEESVSLHVAHRRVGNPHFLDKGCCVLRIYSCSADLGRGDREEVEINNCELTLSGNFCIVLVIRSRGEKKWLKNGREN